MVVGSAFDGSLSRLTEQRDNSNLYFMDEWIYICSSDDDLELEEVEDPRRSLSHNRLLLRTRIQMQIMVGGLRGIVSSSRGENSSNHSQINTRLARIHIVPSNHKKRRAFLSYPK